MRLFFLTFLALLFAPFITQAESIENFDVDITIQEDTSIIVEEMILYDFEDESRHGIYRDITKDYKARGGNFSLRVHDVKVIDEIGRKVNFETSEEGRYFRIKIGDADTYVTGKKTYVIQYRVERAMNFFDAHDELYWNATGDEWEVPIKDATATVYFPDGVKMQDVKIECFAGFRGSTDTCITKEIRGNTAFFAHSFSQIQQGLTIVVGQPKGFVILPSWQEDLFWILQDNWYIIIIPIVFLSLFFLWFFKGRDPKDTRPVITQFNPPRGLSVVEVQIILEESMSSTGVSANIIDLAIRGYIKIQKVEKKTLKIFSSEDYILSKTDAYKNILHSNQEDQIDSKSTLQDFEVLLLDAIFNGKDIVEMSSISSSTTKKNLLVKAVKKYEKALYKKVTSNGYFVLNPHKARQKYTILALAIFIFMMLALPWLTQTTPMFIMGLFVMFIVVIVFANAMPKRTLQGVQTRKHILGLKRYIEVAEVERIRFHNVPEKNPELFEKLLPYAMIFGLEKEWAKAFENIYIEEPSWYSGSSIGAFNASSFASSLGGFATAASSSMATSSSGGSGFSGGGSGGGGGGGGGGSW